MSIIYNRPIQCVFVFKVSNHTGSFEEPMLNVKLFTDRKIFLLVQIFSSYLCPIVLAMS